MSDQNPNTIESKDQTPFEEDTKNSQQISHSGDKLPEECADVVSKALDRVFPDDITIDFDNHTSNTNTKSIIEESNEKAKTAIIKSYAENETERVKRQKYLLWAVVALTAIQMIFFNLVIAGAVFLSFKSGEQDTINSLFDILKYYIGATVVELIGMIVYITSGTFSASHVDTMKMLIQGSKK